jgi:hypothetical protein
MEQYLNSYHHLSINVPQLHASDIWPLFTLICGKMVAAKVGGGMINYWHNAFKSGK